MLVLSRKQGESIDIGDKRVTVRVMGISGSKVRLGVEAPPEVAVHRSEVAERYAAKGVPSSPVFSRSSQVAVMVDGGKGVISSSSAEGSRRQKPKGRSSGQRKGSRDVLEGPVSESLMDDLARAQAEIAALAELVSPRDRMVARQVASEAVERLTAVERTLRFLGRRRLEQPIAAYVDCRSRELAEITTEARTSAAHPAADAGNADCGQSDERARCGANREAHTWSDCEETPSTMTRESHALFRVATSTLSRA